MHSQDLLDRLQPVFIVGAPKSGTTFLYSLLDSHPTALCLLESEVYLFNPRTNPAGRNPTEAIQEFLRNHGGPLYASLDEERFRHHLERQATPLPREGIQRRILRALVATVAEVSDGRILKPATHFIEKTPGHFKRASEIFRDFPTAKIIHMIRDPRDNYLSLRRRLRDEESLRFSDQNYHPITFVQNRVIAGLEGAAHNVARFTDRYRVLFYEDLIHGGKRMVERVRSWIGLEWHENLMVPTLRGELWRGNSFSPDLKGHLEAFDTRPIGRWKRELNRREIVLTEFIVLRYGLLKKYPVTRHRNALGLLGALSLPFEGEVAREFRRLAGSPRSLPGNALRIPWYYLRRRSALYQNLTSMSDNSSLIDHSF